MAQKKTWGHLDTGCFQHFNVVLHPKDSNVANNVDPNQTAPLDVVSSGSALFAQTFIVCLKYLELFWYERSPTKKATLLALLASSPQTLHPKVLKYWDT